MLTFTPHNHEYRWSGKVVPSVTTILDCWKRVQYGWREFYVNAIDGTVVDAETFEAAGDFGTAVHMAAPLVLAGTLDWDALDPELVKPCRQLEEWQRDMRPEIVAIEKPLYSVRYGYAGTPDIICRIARKLIVCDIKTGGFGLVGPQTASYAELHKEHTGYRGKMERYALDLSGATESYKFLHLTNPRDLDFFRSRHFQYNYLKGAA